MSAKDGDAYICIDSIERKLLTFIEILEET